MKAAEENATEVLRMLIEKKCDIEASNKKGRTAMSFAAAPSNDGSTPRPTPVGTLRLLLESGANPKNKDVRGQTAKDSASRGKRDDSLALFEEFGL
jgi:ankyrin repeat protein